LKRRETERGRERDRDGSVVWGRGGKKPPENFVGRKIEHRKSAGNEKIKI
jgi:hypothetical protein